MRQAVYSRSRRCTVSNGSTVTTTGTAPGMRTRT